LTGTKNKHQSNRTNESYENKNTNPIVAAAVVVGAAWRGAKWNNKQQKTGGFMKHSNKLLAATFLAAALLLPGSARAMEIQQYDKLAIEDQVAYQDQLILGAERVLKDEGHADLAAKVEHLFTTIDPGDAHTIGDVELERNLAILRADDSKNAIKHPNDPRLEVEDAMYATLDKNGIKLPDSFYSVGKNFKPKHPPQSSDSGKKKN
jgi:hypothetical protein